MLATHVEVGLVCLSVAVAVIASYAALDLAQRSAGAEQWRRHVWIGAAGITMGLGIWSMHFIGMLALRMPMPVSYDDVLVVLSLLAAVVGASVALAVVARPEVSVRALFSAAAFMGLAIAAMHYLGMASMRMSAVIQWNVPLIAASLAIAFLASLFALWLVVRIRLSAHAFGFGQRVVAALLLGLGVAGLHYTAMAASSFRATGGGMGMAPHGLATDSLVLMLSLGASVMLAVVIGGAAVDQRRAALAGDLSLVVGLARQLSRIGEARERVCETVRELAEADVVLLVEPTDRGGQSVTAAAGVELGAELEQVTSDPGVLAALRSAHASYEADLAVGGESPLRRLTGAASVLFEPLSLEGKPVGLLVVVFARRVRQPSERTRTLLSMLAAEAAVAIDREALLSRLEYLSRRDELTGLLNRRVLAEELERQVAVSVRHERPLSLVMLDLDHFKDYNDTHGHQAGDLLLRSAAAAWTAVLRPGDTLARYGGEEFIVVLPDCPLEAAVITADRLREAMPAGASCSAGVALLGERASSADLIRRADKALYEAKNSGRNQTSTEDGASQWARARG